MRRPSTGGGGAGGVTLSSLAITPSAPTPSVGQKIQLTATGTYSDESTLNDTSAVAWASDDHNVATVTNGTGGGLLTIVGAGTVHISASLAGKSGAISITITGAEFMSATPFSNGSLVNGGTPTVYRRPNYIVSDVAELTLRIRNIVGSTGPLGTDINGVNIALYKSDGAGGGTGSPLGKWLGVTIPGDGSNWVAPDPTQIIRGTDGKILLANSLPPGALVSALGQVTHGTYATGTDVVDPLPASQGADPSPVLIAHFDYITSRRRFGVFGDSISVGTVSESGYETSAWYLLGPNKDYAIESVGLPGATLSQFAQFGGQFSYIWDDVTLQGIDAWIQLGVNDLGGGSPGMINAFNTIVNHLRASGVIKIYANTISPQASYAGTEAARLAYNAFVMANSLGLDGIADFAAKQTDGGMADNTDDTVLYSPYSADGTHWTDAGHAHAHALVAAVVG